MAVRLLETNESSCSPTGLSDGVRCRLLSLLWFAGLGENQLYNYSKSNLKTPSVVSL